MDTRNIRFGTTAHHTLGDISREDGGFFHVDSETETDYIGAWLTGFGFIEVRFPKETTRELTGEERDWLSTQDVVIV